MAIRSCFRTTPSHSFAHVVATFCAVALVLPGIFASTDSANASAAERWTSLLGSRTVEADFVGLWGNEVVLQLPDDRRVAVDIDNLIAESRIQARRMAAEQENSRQEMVSQIQADAKEAAAPAPNPLPKPRSTPAYQDFTAGKSLMDQIEWMTVQNRNGHGLIAMFDSLPPGYQGEIERLVRMSVSKLDMSATEGMLRAVHSIGDLMITRQRWIFSYPRFKALPEDSGDTVKGLMMAVGGLIRDGVDPNELKLTELPKMTLRSWIMNLDKLVAPHLAELERQQEQLGVQAASYNVTTEKDGKATLEVTSGEQVTTVNLVTVEAMWMLEDLDQEQFTEKMQEWETALESIPDGSLLSGGAGMMVSMGISGMIDPLKSAESARDFHAALDAMMAQAAPMIAMAAQFSPAGRRGGRGGYGGGYGDGYGDGYEDDMMDMEGMDDYEEEMMNQQMMMERGR